MLAANDVLHGWSPAGDDDIEVNVSQDMCFMSINPFITSNALLSPACPPLSTDFPNPPSHPSKSILDSHTAAPSSDRRAQRNRNRDPSWIPRPRNAFIIFRCEYSRDHAQTQDPSQNDQDPSVSVKTLSKRAAEAWKQLSAAERERYKALADIERDEHARLYPHYRFRPVKRQGSMSRRNSCDLSESPHSASVERPPAASSRVPSVLAPAQEQPRQDVSVGLAEVAAPMPQVATVPLPEASLYPVDESDPGLPLGNGPVLFYPSPEALIPSDSSPCSTSVDLHSPLCAARIPADTFHYDDLNLALDDPERAQALEAYAIGLYDHDLFSPFSFPDYY